MNVTKKNPCPICGKSDYCGWVNSQNGILISCHRVLDVPKDFVMDGIDGKRYVSIRTKNGCGIFEEEEQLIKARMDYYDYKKSPNKKFFNKNRGNPCLNSKKQNLEQFIAPDEMLNEVYSCVIEQISLNEKHKKNLNAEGWTEEMIENSGFYSVPDIKILKDIILELSLKYNLEGVPGFYKVKDKWNAKFIRGMVIPVYNIEGLIVRLRIKPDWSKKQIEEFNIAQKKAPKYLNFSSFKEGIIDGKVVNLLNSGTRSGSLVSYFFNEDDEFETVIITEGDKKAKAVNLLRKMPCVSLPGVSTYNKLFDEDNLSGVPDIVKLKSKGLKRAIICYDADKKNNKDVKKAEHELVKKLEEHEIEVYIGTWDIEDGKGIDDLLLCGKVPKLLKLKS